MKTRLIAILHLLVDLLLAALAAVPFALAWLLGAAIWLVTFLAAAAVDGFERGRNR